MRRKNARAMRRDHLNSLASSQVQRETVVLECDECLKRINVTAKAGSWALDDYYEHCGCMKGGALFVVEIKDA